MSALFRREPLPEFGSGPIQQNFGHADLDDGVTVLNWTAAAFTFEPSFVRDDCTDDFQFPVIEFCNTHG